MERDTVTLTIPPQHGGALLASARELVAVKREAIARTTAASPGPVAMEQHRAELLAARRLADDLAAVVQTGRQRALAASRWLLDEVVADALVVETQALAEAAMAAAAGRGLGDLRSRCRTVADLVATLAQVRER